MSEPSQRGQGMPEPSRDTETERTDWHRILGVVFAHTFADSSFEVQLEFDVATTPKRIDILVTSPQDAPTSVPLLAEGIEGLKQHNLFTFKSHQESLTSRSLEELIGYYSAYLKTAAPSNKKELDRDSVRLFAIGTRRPSDILNNPKIPNLPIKPGVYEVEYGITPIRLIVINELELNKENANLLLFSNLRNRVEYAMKQHQLTPTKYETLIGQLLKRYQEEGDQDMIDLLNPTEDDAIETWAQIESARKKFLKKIPLEDRLEGIPAEKRLEGLGMEDILKALSPEQLAELTKLASQKINPNDPPKS